MLLWLAACTLVAAQLLLVWHLRELNRQGIGTGLAGYVPSEVWRYAGIFTPIGIGGLAALLQFRWMSGLWQGVAAVALVCLVPVSLFGLMAAAMGGPTTLASARLADGRRYVLALEPVLTDAVYALYEESDPFGLVWRQAAMLDYSEDGRFIGNERLVLSPSEQWLLVERDGVWTDCFRLRAGLPSALNFQPYPDWSLPDYDANMRLRSARIAALTGMRP